MTADAVIIGGGVIGASVAFHLATLGARSVVLCERREPGVGASGASGAFIQYHFCQNDAEAHLTLASLPYFQHWDDLVGAGDCGFVPAGYLRLEPSAAEGTLRERVALLQRLGVETSVVSPQDVACLAPYLRTEGVTIAAYEPGSGYADANATLSGFLEAARREGVEIHTGTTVTALRVESGAITAVETPDGTIATPLVVLAAGAWTPRLTALLGVTLPITGTLTQWLGFDCPDLAAPALMTVGDGVSGSYFRALEPGSCTLLTGLGGVARRALDDPDAGEAPIPEQLIETARQRLAERLHGAESARYVGGRVGPVTLTPDNLPIIDALPGVSGAYLFAGDCGASFKTAPAIGKVLAEWALHGAPQSVDVSAFRLSRFDRPRQRFSVREATAADVSAARALMLRVFEEDFGYGYKPEFHADVDDMQAVYIDHPRHTLIVAVDDDTGEVVGTAGVRSGGLKPEFNPSWLVARYDPQRTAQLVRVYVARGYRGAGVARALVERTMRFVAENGTYSVLALHSDPRSPGAERFWRSMPTTLILDDRDGPSGSLHFEMEIPPIAQPVGS
jgi:sarcosine oxidase, subunit beta